MIDLPSEGPSALGRCNCDTLSPNRDRDIRVMNRGFADEAVVIVKQCADEKIRDLNPLPTSLSHNEQG